MLHDDATSFFQLPENPPNQTPVLLLRWLALMGLVPIVMRRLPDRGRRGDVAACQIYINPTSVLFGCEVKAHLTAYPLDTRLELLHAARRVVSLAHNDM